jgi:hypothetical protein
MKQTPYYRSPTSIVSFLAGGLIGVAAATLFIPPPVRTPPAKVTRPVRDWAAEAALALDGKRSQ